LNWGSWIQSPMS